MLKRALIVTGLVLCVAGLTVPTVDAGPLPSAQCSNVCDPGVACSTLCWALGPLDGKWYRITCTNYHSLFVLGGHCGPLLISTTSSEPGLDNFLRSLESLADEGSMVPGL